MPSSTSDSEPTPLRRLATWVLAFALAAAALGAYEARLRARGIRPSVTDDKELWAATRARAVGAGPRTLALCGASRIQLAFSIDEAKAVEPGLDVVQLAIDGTNAVGSYRDLALDPTFRGTALLSMLPGSLARNTWDDQAAWVARAKAPRAPDAVLSRALRCELQRRLALLAPEAELFRFASAVARRGGPPQQPMVMRADRGRTVDYSRVDVPSYAAARLARDRAGLASSPKGPDYAAWLAAVDEVDAWTRALIARGGRAVFFHDLLSGDYRRVYEEAYPRATYWDVVAARSSAKCVHARDVPGIAALSCPDGSHLDARDAPAFTRALLAAIR